MKEFDFGIIGAGPAGYTAAIRASQLGKSVVLFEREFLGGTCLNKGCIPTKAFLHAADTYKSLKKLSTLGISAENITFDFSKMADRKDKIVEKIRKSLELLLKSYDIEIVKAEAKKEGDYIVANEETYKCEHVLFATGAGPRCVGGFEYDHEFILNSDDVLELKELPKSVVIVGSGAIGIEWARIFSDLGVEVSIVELAPHLLPLADEEISTRLERTFKMAKIKMYLEHSVEKIEDKKVVLSGGEELSPDYVVFATGRKPIHQDGAQNEIGDAYGAIQLAHFASHQAVQVIENIVLGKDIKEFLTPAVVYGIPEIAWVGKTEQDLVKENIEYKKSVFPIAALGKAQADSDIEGFIKVLASSDDKILGAHIISKEASSMIMQCAIAMQNNLTVEDIKHCCFAHPTYSEGVYEAFLGLDKQSLSLLKQ